jgi:death-on-curing protein
VARLKYLERSSVEQIAHKLAAQLFTDYGDPLPTFQLLGGDREGGALLDSALGAARQRYYRRLHDKAAVLLRSLIKNHPLVDGNKRVAMTSTFVFLAINNYVLLASNREMVDFALRIAREKPDVTWQEIAAWLRARTIRVDASDREIEGHIRDFPEEWQEPEKIRAYVGEYARTLAQLVEK